MVKYTVFLVAALCALGCGHNKETEVASYKAFDSSRYELKGYSERVKSFLLARPETSGIADYQAIFVNTKGCSACIKGAFSGIYDFLDGTPGEVFIYANDDSLKKLVPERKNVHFVRLPPEEFESREIRHKELYLYTMTNDTFITTHLNLRRRDSISALYRKN